MATTADLPDLLSTLTDSLTIANSSLPESKNLVPPTDGISLLDTKNELLLTYLQNLVFLILLKLRNHDPSRNGVPSDGDSHSNLKNAVTRKLVELRIYLEKGVRPLESRLKYQLDKLLLAASEAVPATQITTTLRASNGLTKAVSQDSDEDIEPVPPAAISDLSYRPNPAAFARPSNDTHSAAKKASDIYRPPRIAPTALPTTERKQSKITKPRKSQTLDAFIREEMEDAPIAEPSIGAGSGLRGKEREREEERRGYEEQRLVRLPGEKKSKRDKRQGEDLSGGLMGLGDVDFGNVKAGKRKRESEGGGGERIGERWEKRVKKGVGRKRR